MTARSDVLFITDKTKLLKSAQGQSRRFNPLPVTSGLPRTTDINRPAPLVRFVPEADQGCPFNTADLSHRRRRRQACVRGWLFFLQAGLAQAFGDPLILRQKD